jgi:hypothetical protein
MVMGNWRHEEISAIRQAFDRMASAPRVEGKCQALQRAHRGTGESLEVDLVCLECGFETIGPVAQAVTEWNSHIIFR